MKQGIISAGILALLIGATGQAQAARLGMHGVYSNGADVEESELGFGGQLEIPLNPILSVELAVTQFSDEWEADGAAREQDLTSIGLSAVFRGPIGPHAEGYMLFGANYNTVDQDISIDPPIVSSNGTVIGLEAETDDEVGFHIGAGMNFTIAYNMELFAEYRYTFLELEHEVAITGSSDGVTMSVPYGEGESDYDFGLAKLGMNFLF